MARSVKKGPFIDEHLMKKVRRGAAHEVEEGHQDLVAPLDDHPRDGRPDVRRAQRPQVRPGVRHREHGRPQARRVRADAHVPRPLGRPQGGVGSELGARGPGASRSKETRHGTRSFETVPRVAPQGARGRGHGPRSLGRRRDVDPPPAEAQGGQDALEGARLGDRQRPENEKADVEKLVVSKVFIDGGPVSKRWMPRSMGRANRIHQPHDARHGRVDIAE